MGFAVPVAIPYSYNIYIETIVISTQYTLTNSIQTIVIWCCLWTSTVIFIILVA